MPACNGRFGEGGEGQRQRQRMDSICKSGFPPPFPPLDRRRGRGGEGEVPQGPRQIQREIREMKGRGRKKKKGPRRHSFLGGGDCPNRKVGGGVTTVGESLLCAKASGRRRRRARWQYFCIFPPFSSSLGWARPRARDVGGSPLGGRRGEK